MNNDIKYIKRLREEQAEYPSDIVTRLLNAADQYNDGERAKPLLLEAAITIDNLRNGRGG